MSLKKENETENKYIELIDIEDIKQFLEDNEYLEFYSIEGIFTDDEDAEIELKQNDIKIQIIMDNVKKFNIDYYVYYNSIDCVNVEYDNDNKIFKILMVYDFADIMDIEAEKVTFKTLDIINTKYQYVSVKYKEDSDKTFYYISNIENLKIGDYVYVPVRDTNCVGIVDNIEYFSYKDVPFPVKRTKKIIRKSSAEEFEKFNKKDETTIENDYKYTDNFKFDERDELYNRAKFFPMLHTQEVEWEGTKRLDNGAYTMPFPKYGDEILNWIKSFHDLKLLDYNYLKNYKDYKDKKLDELTFEETLSYLTYLIRGERFCDGLISTRLADGTIETLCKNILSTYIEFKNITEQDIENLKEDNIMCFTLAEGGAMGEPCGIKIIAKKENKLLFFRANYDTSFEGGINIEKLYPIFPTLKTLNCGIFGVVTGVQENFVHIDTGVGNHLFVNKLISDKMENELIDKPVHERYGLWFRKALDILGYEWD